MSRKKGDKFEKELSKKLNLDINSKSGGHWDNADLSDFRVLVEAKVKDEEFFKPSKRDLQKVIRQSEKHGKDWIYIQRTNGGDFVVCSLDFFLEAAEEFFK